MGVDGHTEHTPCRDREPSKQAGIASVEDLFHEASKLYPPSAYGFARCHEYFKEIASSHLLNLSGDRQRRGTGA